MNFLKRGIVATLCMATVLPARGQYAQQTDAGEIRDPYTGAIWMFVRDEEHPGGPGRLVLVERGSNSVSGTVAKPLVIHAGDRIVVEEHSAVADAWFEAIAEASAAKGQTLRARMKIGGRLVTVLATSKARAVFSPEVAR